MYEQILVPTDGSDGAKRALEHALAIADSFDASIHTLHVVRAQGISDALDEDEYADVLDRLDEAGRDAVETVESRAAEAGHEVETTVTRGVPATEIEGYAAENDVDVIVMATAGRTGSAREMLGSVTEAVIRSSSVPVLTVEASD